MRSKIQAVALFFLAAFGQVYNDTLEQKSEWRYFYNLICFSRVFYHNVMV